MDANPVMERILRDENSLPSILGPTSLTNQSCCLDSLSKSSSHSVCFRTKLMSLLIIKRKKPHEAQSIFKSFTIESQRPTLITYTTFLAALVLQKQYKSILSLVSNVEENRMTPDFIFFNAVINALSESGKFDQAMEVFQKHKEQVPILW
ncbi:hypothetical protein CRG98_041429 [Punica granatum]|uniref:Pentatricopeptide repeat-containing protein n=1 Tax=Punica granatum TaxID=22663 RepID=A0A2I0I411_PUNGR|nr:hypothetical protein CRG98_041429 [Punica granatum]